MNYYEKKLEEIKLLISDNKIKAFEMLNEELKMPYIPEKYETQFINLADQLNFEINEKTPKQKLSREQIIEYLFSLNDLKVAASIEALRYQNIRTYLNEIERWLFMNKNDSVSKAIIYEILAEQQIDKEVLFGEFKINPYKLGPLMMQKKVKNYIEKIMNSNKSPQIKDIALQELQFYILKIFPNLNKLKNNIADNLLSIIESMLDGNYNFENEKLEIYNIIKQK